MGIVMIVAAIWVAISLALWIHFKIMHRKDPVLPDGPPQRTLVGSLMWPFYLLAFLWNWFTGVVDHVLLNKRPKP